MKLVDYLVRRKRYNELRHQLSVTKEDIDINAQVYGIYSLPGDEGLKRACIRRHTELRKKEKFLEKELREIFKE